MFTGLNVEFLNVLKIIVRNERTINKLSVSGVVTVIETESDRDSILLSVKVISM